MDDILIYKIAPLCPFLYLTLRLVCKKYWKALIPLSEKEDTKNFAILFKWYTQGLSSLDFMSHSLNMCRFFVKAIEPKMRGYDFTFVSDHRISSSIIIQIPQYVRYNDIDKMIGRKCHQDFFEYICEHMCQLHCCGNTWIKYFNMCQRKWMISYDAVPKLFILYNH